MTGYGKAVCELPQKKVSIEIKSLNSKQLDLNTRIPSLYREKELEIRNDVNNVLSRGKVDVSLYVESSVSDKIAVLNTSAIEAYYDQLKVLAQKFEQAERTDYLRLIMPLPETIKMEQPQLDEQEWKAVKDTIATALEKIVEFRRQEGLSLAADLHKRIEIIKENLALVPQYEQGRVEKVRARIQKNLEEIIEKTKIDENRLEQELIFYIEKLDINEEKVRLANHIKYFIETMENEEQPGRKLGFIAQEMGREINTLGSKANEANLQRIVIKMKDELEKIKEQVLNVL